MYREEIDLLFNLFKNNCNKVTISDSHHRYDSLDEMKSNIGPIVNDLDIRGENPGVHFLLNQRKRVEGSSVDTVLNELRTEEITEEADALFLRIKEFLTQHSRPAFSITGKVLAVVEFIVVLWIGFRNRAVLLAGSELTPVGQVVMWVSLIVIGATLTIFYNANYLTLETKLNSPSFWDRHKDEFAKNAVTSTISAISGLVLGYIVGRFTK
jgi:hypothetical protein